MFYEKIKENYSYIIPNNFDLDLYNKEIINKEYIKYKEYFENMFNEVDSNIHLDEEQIKAILTDEDYSLIIAGAGTGKTTTIVAKVKYLVEIKKVDPSKIIVMSYTKKATEELEKRIVIDFGIPAIVTTFNALGMMHIREIFKNRKCFVVDENTKKNIFFEYFKNEIFPYNDKVKEIIDNFNIDSKNFILGKHFIENYYKYNTYEDYFENYKMEKLNELIDLKEKVDSMIDKKINSDEPTTINNEFVKSKGEAIIANFLYINGISYNYEKIYRELMNDNRTYKPDFTLDLGGEEVYIEYFGYSTYDKDKIYRYEKIKKIKEEYHAKHHNKFIKIDYDRPENIILKLKAELTNYGFKFKPKTYEEIFFKLLDNNPMRPIFSYMNFLYRCIEIIKSSIFRKNYLNKVYDYINKLKGTEQKTATIQFKYINDFYKYYQNKLFGAENYGFDFSDMIYYANTYIDKIGKNNSLDFKYLIIDEYQDISSDRYLLAKNIAVKNRAKILAVGDDWQSIYSFVGSNI